MNNSGGLQYNKMLWFILAVCLLACSPNSKTPKDVEVCTHAKQGQIERSRICGTRVGCGKIDPLECINVMHSIVQNYMKAAAYFVQSGAEKGQVITEFSNALCRLQDIIAELDNLKINNFTEWKILYDSGFITQTKMMAVAVSIEIFNPYTVNRHEDPESL